MRGHRTHSVLNEMYLSNSPFQCSDINAEEETEKLLELAVIHNDKELAFPLHNRIDTIVYSQRLSVSTISS